MVDLLSQIANLTPAKRALLEMKLQGKERGSSSESAIGKRRSPDSTKLSSAQQRMWFLTQLEPDSPFYNIARALKMKGALNAAALEASLDLILSRHEALRTTFDIEDGEPKQIIRQPVARCLPLADLEELSESDQHKQLLCLMRESARRLFDLTNGPLLRAALVKTRDREHFLLLAMHHIISDGWSLGVFLNELSALYEAFSSGKPSPLAELPIQYADFAVWQQQWMLGEVMQEHLSYWKKQLDASHCALKLPAPLPRPAARTYRGQIFSYLMPEALSAQLKSLSSRQNVTAFMTLLAAFKIVLFRYTGQEDISVGSSIANRNRTEVENLIGFFVNTLVLRAKLNASMTFLELLDRVRAITLEAYAHQDVPFEKVVEVLQPERALGDHPLFQVMFEMQNAPMEPRQLPGLELSLVEIHNGSAKFDLSLEMRETAQGLIASVEYSTDLFDSASIDRLLKDYETLLRAIASDPHRCLSDLPMLSEIENHQILVDRAAPNADKDSVPAADKRSGIFARKSRLSARRDNLPASKRAWLEQRLRGE